MKKIIALFIILSIVISLSFNISAESFSWYIVRNKENKQPSTDTKYSFIDKYNG